MRSIASPLLAALALALAPAAAAQAAVPSKLSYVTGLAGTHPQVHVANADGSGDVRLGPGADALISPDGTTVAIVTPYTRRGTSLVVRPAAGGAARTLLRAAQSLGPLVWSPDGTRLAVTVNLVDTARLLVIDVASGARHVVARGQIQGASFSPDGERIAYARSAQRFDRGDIYVARADGSGAHAITHDGRSLYPLWGPTRIAYTHERLRRADAPVYQLRVMRPDGGGVRQLTHMRIPRLLSGLTATAWSADGRRLLAEYGGQDTSEAWTVDVASGRARDLTGRLDGVIGRGLSADGRTVLVQRGFFDDPRHQSIATVPFRGGRATVLVRRGSLPSWGG
ncbi:MAG: PD40 domain-containing protein [Actinobacteria bacterium]|nr:PD40 domain-containing protein [Actinomycetota bacterium]